MQFCLLLLSVTILTHPLLTKSEITSVLINQFKLAHASFSTLLRTWVLNSTSSALFVSCFNPIPETKDYVYTVPNIEWQLKGNITPILVTDQIIWPNGVISANPLVEYSMMVPSGFLVPGKSNGNLYYISETTPIPLVPNDKMNWFYHDAAFKDMDGDGHIDIIAGRANIPVVGEPTTQLIWLKNPGNLTISGPWQLNYLLTNGGPDIQVQFARLTDSFEVLFANSFFERKLQMYWSNADPLWNDISKLRVRHIDYEALTYAYIQLTMDLNGDQKPDLLVTVNDEFNGSLIAYELPSSNDIRTGHFVKHVLASGFKSIVQVKGRGAPGQAIAIQFYSLTARKKPVLILSGDDDGCVYLLEAMHDNDPSNWEYSKRVIHRSEKSTIGQISVEDVDNDGHPEMFVPAYNEGIVYIYQLIDK